MATKCLASQEKEVTTLSINRDLGIVSCLRNGVEYRTVGLCQLMNMYHSDGKKKVERTEENQSPAGTRSDAQAPEQRSSRQTV